MYILLWTKNKWNTSWIPMTKLANHRNSLILFETRDALPTEVSANFHIYRPQRSCGQGNIFTPVCHSVHRGVCLSACWDTNTPPEQTPPWEQNPPPEQTPPGADTPPREADSSIRSTSGRYASYWNEFLLRKMVLKTIWSECFKILWLFCL